jgi:hypothetical protein
MAYVYIYFDPRKPGKFTFEDLEFDFEPFYVGLGKFGRMYAHLNLAKTGKGYFDNGRNPRKINRIKSILADGLEPIIVKFKDDISYEECKLLEKDLIRKIGRRDLNLVVLGF